MAERLLVLVGLRFKGEAKDVFTLLTYFMATAYLMSEGTPPVHHVFARCKSLYICIFHIIVLVLVGYACNLIWRFKIISSKRLKSVKFKQPASYRRTSA